MARAYTRNLIKTKFLQKLEEKPLNKITVKELVAECEINRNTFYYYFRDLYDVLTECLDDEVQRVSRSVQNSDSWQEVFRSACSFGLEHQKAFYHIYYSVRREDMERYLLKVTGTVIGSYVERVNARIGASQQDCQLITGFYQCAITQMSIQWFSIGMPTDVEGYVARLESILDGNIERSLTYARNNPQTAGGE